MIAGDIEWGEWTTPRGHAVRMAFRPDTNDWNAINSIMGDNDEYGIRSLGALTGVAVDAGAHVGAFTLALLADFPDLVVHAIEPVPENFWLLEAAVVANGFASRARLHLGAVGKRGTPVAVHWDYQGDASMQHHRFVGNSTMAGPGSARRTQSYPVFDLAALGRIALLKLDVEGGEWALFADSPQLAQVDAIVGEFHGAPGADVIRALPEFAVTVDPSKTFGPFHARRKRL